MTEDPEVLEPAIEETGITEVESKQPLTGNPFASKSTYLSMYPVAKNLAMSDMIPSAYQKRPENCMIAIDIANRMGVSPMAVMQQLYIVRGKPTWSGQACLGLIKTAYKKFRVVYSGKEGTDERACHIEVTDSDGQVLSGSKVSIQMAKQEGWYGKSDSKWRTMPEQMLAYRAGAFFCRIYLPNQMMGFAVEGEAEDISKGPTAAPDLF